MAVPREGGYITVVDRKKDMVRRGARGGCPGLHAKRQRCPSAQLVQSRLPLAWQPARPPPPRRASATGCSLDNMPQVLVGGENVYSSEVEAVLQQHPAVAQAAVFAMPHPVLGERVAAAAVLRPGTLPGAAGGGAPLVEWCRARLAHYKVPAEVFILDALPTTGSGKVLKRTLREMAEAGTLPLAGAAAAPQETDGVAIPGVPPAELARAAAAALGGGARVLHLGVGGDTDELDGAATYVLPLTDDTPLPQQVGSCGDKGVTEPARLPAAPGTLLSLLHEYCCVSASQRGRLSLCMLLPRLTSPYPPGIRQVSAAVAAGARSLLLLAGSPPDATACASLAATLAEAPGAQAAVAVLDAAAASSKASLQRALFEATPAGGGHHAGVLLPAQATVTSPAYQGVRGVAPGALAAAAQMALGSGVPLVALPLPSGAAPLEVAGCFVLPLADGATAADQVG